MKRLTRKEEEIMDLFWENGPLFVRELRERYNDPKPHFNTLSTMVRILEREGFLAHTAVGNSFRYQPCVTREQYRLASLASVVDRYFGNSYVGAVASMVDDGKLSLEDLKGLVEQIGNGR